MLNQPDSRITHSKKAKKAQNAKKPDKAKLNKKSKDLDNFTFARINLLVLACLTLLNLAFLAFGLDISLLFSAIIPYFSMFLGVEYINAGMPLGWICIIPVSYTHLATAFGRQSLPGRAAPAWRPFGPQTPRRLLTPLPQFLSLIHI